MVSDLLRFLDEGARDIRALERNLSGEWVVVFAGSFAGGSGHRDGYYQRVRAVDTMLEPFGRIYIDTTRTQPDEAVRILGERMIVVSTASGRLRESAVTALVGAVGRTYIHSLFGANARLLRRMTSLPEVTHIWDVHGAVPEECRYRGAEDLAEKMEVLERILARRAARIVTVSDSMTRHLMRKHGTGEERFITLPPSVDPSVATTRALSFVYSGSVEGWQGFETMMDAIADSPIAAEFTVLVTDADKARAQLGQARDSRIILTSLTPLAARRRLELSAYGFCLREDHVLNRVACPTKLVDYVAAGVVPILSLTDIGDFKCLGLKSVALEDFRRGRLPTEPERMEMARHNLSILAELRLIFERGRRDVLAAFERPAEASRPYEALHA